LAATIILGLCPYLIKKGPLIGTDIRRPNTGEGIRQGSRDRDCRVRKGSRRREPVSRSDPGSDHPRRIRRAAVPKDHEQESECRNRFSQPLCGTRSDVARRLE
jgi:hypothetical protein